MGNDGGYLRVVRGGKWWVGWDSLGVDERGVDRYGINSKDQSINSKENQPGVTMPNCLRKSCGPTDYPLATCKEQLD